MLASDPSASFFSIALSRICFSSPPFSTHGGEDARPSSGDGGAPQTSKYGW
jgi:hypothetical protein